MSSVDIRGNFYDPDFQLRIGLGLIKGFRRVVARGNNPSVDTGTVPEDIWATGGLYPWLSAASAMEILSASANDTAAGTGARTVQIDGLDGNYKEVTQIVTLNGVTPVAIPTSLLRINSAQVVTAGSGRVNAGDITIRLASAGATHASITAGYGVSRRGFYSVPAGNSLCIVHFLSSINHTIGAEQAASIATFIQSPTAGFSILPLEFSTTERSFQFPGPLGYVIPEKNDFSLRVISVSSNSTNITGAWAGFLVDNSYLSAPL